MTATKPTSPSLVNPNIALMMLDALAAMAISNH